MRSNLSESSRDHENGGDTRPPRELDLHEPHEPRVLTEPHWPVSLNEPGGSWRGLLADTLTHSAVIQVFESGGQAIQGFGFGTVETEGMFSVDVLTEGALEDSVITVGGDWLRLARPLEETSALGKESFRDVLEQLDALRRTEEEEDLEPCSAEAVANATRILQEICHVEPRSYHVYPTDDREVAIMTRSGEGDVVLILCDSDGGAGCFVVLGDRKRRARYNNARDLPDGFLRGALTELGRPRS